MSMFEGSCNHSDTKYKGTDVSMPDILYAFMIYSPGRIATHTMCMTIIILRDYRGKWNAECGVIDAADLEKE
ncbi:hypothetical protein BWQ96_02895 [Gracilariopsis chorda]|uniref:Uncharacterized protein n=1 Tax=Gracilariopsis chorda TaxID=448386 RepID=A0A2V3IYQ2_9FLOR|nr:hypothetical protein BWQ96_02895 [Gracilariopsis chorda]|eukprot:PXF47282.1 hypothetical protein BWQ96_02895 [Gracilariopsis chorda]